MGIDEILYSLEEYAGYNFILIPRGLRAKAISYIFLCSDGAVVPGCIPGLPRALHRDESRRLGAAGGQVQ